MMFRPMLSESDRNALRSLGAFVRTTRQVRRMTLQQIRDRGGPAPSWVNKLENDQMIDEPKPATLKKLAVGLGVEYEEVLRVMSETPESPKPWPLHDLSQSTEARTAQRHGSSQLDETILNLSNSGTGSNVAGERNSRGNVNNDIDFDSIPGLLDLAEVSVYGLMSCGAPEWTSEIPVSKILLPAMMLKGVTGAVVVSGESMMGVGFEEGDLLLLRKLDGEKPASGKKVVVNINGECSCKVYRRDNLGEYLEAVYEDGPRRWPVTEQVRLVAVVLRSVKFQEE